MDVKIPVARLSSYQPADGGYVRLDGLTAQEVDRVQGMIHGHWWIRGNEGRLECVPAYTSPPAPTEDLMLPQWRPMGREEGGERYQRELFETEHWTGQSPSILIQHLCGYGYTPEGYKANAELLEGCGFACMRSRRGDNGQYWEIWFLPGLWAARGRLKEALYQKSETHKMRFALKFLREHTSFGTLDIAVQRLCQALD